MRSVSKQRSSPDRRRRRALVATSLLCAAVLASMGCSPGITLKNKASVEVKVAVFPPGGGMSIRTLAAGQSSVVDVSREGVFTAAVVPSKNWLDFAKAKRDQLLPLLDAPGQTPAQVAQLKQQLNEITAKIKSFEKPGGAGDACSATLKSESAGVGSGDSDSFVIPITMVGGGTVDVTLDSANQFHVTCAAQAPSQ
jgi:hypothetical protein